MPTPAAINVRSGRITKDYLCIVDVLVDFKICSDCVTVDDRADDDCDSAADDVVYGITMPEWKINLNLHGLFMFFFSFLNTTAKYAMFMLYCFSSFFFSFYIYDIIPLLCTFMALNVAIAMENTYYVH